MKRAGSLAKDLLRKGEEKERRDWNVMVWGVFVLGVVVGMLVYGGLGYWLF